LFTSEDGGRSWREVKNILPEPARFRAIACSAQHPETAYVASAGRPFMIAKTTDRGGHWTPVYVSTGKSAPNVEDAWLESFYGGTGPVLELGVAPTNPEVCYATDACPRSFRTLDGGRTWQQ